MPVTPTYPGVYVEEIPSGVRTITGVATSVTAFIGRAPRGPANDEAVPINSFGDFERIFGGLWIGSKLGFAVRDFYLNGGRQAVIVRLYHPEFKEVDRQKVEGAANAIATEAKAGTDGADAKAKAKAKSDAIEADNAKSSAEKKAAKTVSDIIQGAPDAAKPADVAKIADSAVIKATPFSKAKLSIGTIKLEAVYEGKWGAAIRVMVDQDQISQDVATSMGLTKADLFNLTVREDAPGGFTEKFLNLSTKPSSRRIDNVLREESKLVRWDGDYPTPSPAIAVGSDAVTTKLKDWQAKKKIVQDKINSGAIPDQNDLTDAEDAKNTYEDVRKTAEDAVSDGVGLTIADFLPPNAQTDKKGLSALERIFAQDGLFNILCIPPYLARNQVPDMDVDVSLVSAAAAYCEERRAMLLVDAPSDWRDKSDAKTKFTDPSNDNVGTRSRNAALFFPRLKQPNPLHDGQMEEFVPSGAVAGIFARTDTQRGVWKAPAGLDATLVGVPRLSVSLTDDENGELNPLGVNCLRVMPAAGRVVWGSRTLRGADQLADEYKYIPVRRTALYIEESLYRGLKWVVFEPNDEPLWAQIRLNVGAFMHNLFRQSAFQGKTPREAYFVKCDHETTTQNDINLGIVNIVVGFAPLKPAEFVIIKLQQMAGQIEA
jgi:phage tail sheath protein FI